ncbi:helix-turn-helix domain-containing protein [Patulibacter sp. NPDC049589]|uniref:IclR family transcriptional regulator n=1 Tax=Patulibacter sp. NPDC049589 TaxID=3154731 RepID=UPI00342FF2E4
MSQALQRGLTILEALGERSVGVRELARQLGFDKGALSRTLAMLAREGWAVRDAGGYRLGPRAQALGAGGDSRGAIARAARIAHVVSGLTGATTFVMQLAGSRPLLVATTPGPETPSADGWDPPAALWATAGGVALLAQLPPADVEPFLSEDPWPRYSAASPEDPSAVRRLVAAVREGGAARERAWSHPASACIAVPWPSLEPDVPSTLVVAGYSALLIEHDGPFERLLRRAVTAGTTPEELAGDGLVRTPTDSGRRTDRSVMTAPPAPRTADRTRSGPERTPHADRIAR